MSIKNEEINKLIQEKKKNNIQKKSQKKSSSLNLSFLYYILFRDVLIS
jgi:hypothetical protein